MSIQVLVRGMLLFPGGAPMPTEPFDTEDPIAVGDEGDDLDDGTPLEFVIGGTDDDDEDVRWEWDGSVWRRRF